MGKKKRLLDEYQFPGFRPRSKIQGIFGDPKARVIRLKRTPKKLPAVAVARCIGVITTRQCGGYGIYLVGMRGFTWRWRFGGWSARGAGK
jgi:hypothetical protein